MYNLQYTLRAVQPNDATDLQKHCHPEQPVQAVESYLRWCITQMKASRMARLVAEVGGHAIANGQLTVHRRRGEIGSLVVAPVYRRQGIGSALLETLTERARAGCVELIEIAARQDMPWVQAWYQRRGFVPHGVEDRPGEGHVVVLHLRLKSVDEHRCPAARTLARTTPDATLALHSETTRT